MPTSETLRELNWNPSISSPEDSLARISARPESGPELKALARAFGLNLPVSLGSFDPGTCSLRTSQASLFQEQCPEWSESWPDSGMWDAGAVYELQSSAPVIYESASSLWPTARSEDSESCGNHPGATDSLTGATRNW